MTPPITLLFALAGPAVLAQSPGATGSSSASAAPATSRPAVAPFDQSVSFRVVDQKISVSQLSYTRTGIGDFNERVIRIRASNTSTAEAILIWNEPIPLDLSGRSIALSPILPSELQFHRWPTLSIHALPPGESFEITVSSIKDGDLIAQLAYCITADVADATWLKALDGKRSVSDDEGRIRRICDVATVDGPSQKDLILSPISVTPVSAKRKSADSQDVHFTAKNATGGPVAFLWTGSRPTGDRESALRRFTQSLRWSEDIRFRSLPILRVKRLEAGEQFEFHYVYPSASAICTDFAYMPCLTEEAWAKLSPLNKQTIYAKEFKWIIEHTRIVPVAFATPKSARHSAPKPPPEPTITRSAK